MRPYCSVIIWSSVKRHTTEKYYVVMTHGGVRELKRHRDIRPATLVRNVTKAMADGNKVTFEVCKPDFTVAQSAEFQRSQS
jgi:hypothetical protein